MATSTGDVISTDPTAAYEAGNFVVTGRASSPVGVKSVTLQAFSNAGTVTLGTTAVDASGNFSFTVPIRGAACDDITATEADDGGAMKTVKTGLSLDGNWTGKPYVATEDQFTSLGARYRTLYFRADGSIQGEVAYTPGGSVGLRRVNNADGSNTITVTDSGATIRAVDFDTILDRGEGDNTFVFDPGHGLDLVRQFVGNGTDHDTLSLKGSDFGNSVAEVLANTHQYKGVGTCIVDPVAGDIVRLANVPKAELAVNKGDITFHA